MESLYLEDNELENLDQEAFVNLPVLRELYLKNNQLTFEIQRELIGLGIKYMHFNNQRTPVIEEITEEI